MKPVRQKLINEVRAKTDPYRVILRILDPPFSITIKEFLANSTDLQRVIQKNYLGGNKSDEEIIIVVAANITTDINYIYQDGDIKVGVYSIITIKRFFFVVAAPTVLVIINKIIEYSALVNTGAELNIMIVDVTDRAGLVIKTRVKIKISLYSKYISRFLRIIENILISVGSIVCRVNIFVTRSVSQFFILGISYLHSARAQLLFDDDLMQVLLRSADGRREVRLVG